MATMLMSLVMTMTISLISIYSAQVSVVEQKISANHLKSKQAFEAAQAGMDASIFKLTAAIVDGLNAAGGGIATGTENNLNFDPTQTASYSVDSGNGHYKINFTQNAFDNNIVDFSVFGFSGDNASTNLADADQVIRQSVSLTPTVGYTPPANLISLGSLNIGSNIKVKNTTESTKNAALWAGKKITYDPSSINVSGGNSGVYGGDKNKGDAGLRGLQSPSLPGDEKLVTKNNAFFENFFNESKLRLKQKSTVVNCEKSSCNTSDLKKQLQFDSKGNLLTNIIWVDAYDEGNKNIQTLNLDANFKLGTKQQPVILIVEGKLAMSNSKASVNGIVYTTESFISSAGKGNITGSLMSEGNIDATGKMNFTYDNTATMTNVQTSAGTNRYARIAGTWKDF